MRFQILGPLRVFAKDGPLPVRGSREQKILAMLLLNADRPVSLEHLINAVWDDNPPTTAATQVRNRISGLRKSWSAATPQPDSILRTEGKGYLLRLEGHDLDLRSLEQHVSSAREAAGADNREEAARLLRAALGHWRGPALYGIGGEAVTAAATLLEERRLLHTEECLGHELALGRYRQLIVELSALVGAHPLRERFTHLLMLALYLSGRQPDALACYRRYARTLCEELGLDPSPELRDLHDAILRRSVVGYPPGGGRPDPVLPATATAPAKPADLPDGSRIPAPHAAAFRPAEIPADIVDFTGRVRELQALDAFLPVRDGPLPRGMLIVAVEGTAGAGKTALAIRWAHRVTDRFPDGQLHVNLRGYSQGIPMQPIEALTTMLRAVGADRVPEEPDEAARRFRSLLAGKRMLLVLDHARSAEQVRPLLPGSSGCLVLVTSRNRLAGLVASHGARRLTVDPLSEDEAVELLGRILGPHRVADEREAAHRLAHACALLPLALRIAAASFDSGLHRSIAAYVDELDKGDPLAALRIVDDSLAVQSVFDASYTGLPIDTRRVFRLLGLAPGPDIALDAVSTLTGLDRGQAALAVGRLAAAHLVQPSGSGRFTSHDLLRLYMRQRAEAEDGQEERVAARERLLHWYLDHARAAAGLLDPHMPRLADVERPAPVARFDDRAAAVDWLDAERPNLVAAIDHAATYGPRSVAWRLADVLRGYFGTVR
jgi:DNA-binding SARP family transcriptional activator